MKKILLTLSAVLATMGAANGQNFVSARMDAPVQAPADGYEWMQHCNPDSPSYWQFGAGGSADFGAAARFSKEFLSEYNGKTVSAAAFYMTQAMKDVTVLLKKGDDINTAKEISTQNLAYTQVGWNYVKFDTPVEIDATEAISVAYYMTVTTNDYPTGYDGSTITSADKEKTYYYLDGTFEDATTDFSQLGHALIRVFVDEDPEVLANNVNIDMYNYVERYVPNGEKCDITIQFSNPSFGTIENVTVAYTMNGEEKTQTIPFDPAIQPFTENTSAANSTFDLTADKDYTLNFRVTEVNGKENFAKDKALNYVIQAYDPAKTAERTILIEKFTGQDCGYCPSGEQSIQAAIYGKEDRVARIDHHAGFYDDIFTLDESKMIATTFAIPGAPYCIIDRHFDANFGIAFSPFNLTTSSIDNFLNKPAFATLEINDTFDAANRELTVTVKGEGMVSLQDKKISVVLTQSGYKARQQSGGSNWLHNDFPIVFLTDYNGDALNVNADNTFEMTFKCTIDKEYSNAQGKFTVDMNQLKVVAYINDWNNMYDNQVLNAAFKEAATKGAVENASADDFMLYAADGKIIANKDCTMEVYNLTGAQVENEGLEKGLYIIKAVADGKTYTQKLTVR